MTIEENMRKVVECIANGVFAPQSAQDITNLIGIHKDNLLVEEVGTFIVNDRVDNKLKYIGLVGCQNAGKDHIANYIAKNLERKCEVVKFATKLTQVVAAVLGVDDLSLFQDRQWKENKIFQWQNKIVSARDVQISIGTDIMRNIIDDDIWVDAFSKAYNDPDILYIISDLRFINEFEFVQANNGVVVFIENVKAAMAQADKEKDAFGVWKPHASEKLAWDLYDKNIQSDYHLLNNDYSDPQPLQDLLTFINGI